VGEKIRTRLSMRPFISFRLILTGGMTHDVTDPDLAEVEADAVVKTYRRTPHRPSGRELQAIISLPHVVAVETADEYPILVVSGN
jgi:hypothetical protein